MKVTYLASSWKKYNRTGATSLTSQNGTYKTEI